MSGSWGLPVSGYRGFPVIHSRQLPVPSGWKAMVSCHVRHSISVMMNDGWDENDDNNVDETLKGDDNKVDKKDVDEMHRLKVDS